jgi:hypothetical protein
MSWQDVWRLSLDIVRIAVCQALGDVLHVDDSVEGSSERCREEESVFAPACTGSFVSPKPARLSSSSSHGSNLSSKSLRKTLRAGATVRTSATFATMSASTPKVAGSRRSLAVRPTSVSNVTAIARVVRTTTATPVHLITDCHQWSSRLFTPGRTGADVVSASLNFFKSYVHAGAAGGRKAKRMPREEYHTGGPRARKCSCWSVQTRTGTPSASTIRLGTIATMSAGGCGKTRQPASAMLAQIIQKS